MDSTKKFWYIILLVSYRFSLMRCFFAHFVVPIGNRLKYSLPKHSFHRRYDCFCSKYHQRSLHLNSDRSTNGLVDEISESINNQRSLRAAYEDAMNIFQKNKISEPESSARYILCEVTGIGYRYTDFQANLDDCRLNTTHEKMLEAMIEQRLEKMPVQYILGDIMSEKILSEVIVYRY